MASRSSLGIAFCWLALATLCGCSPTVQSQEKPRAIQDAIQRGAAYLEAFYSTGDDFKTGDHPVGMAALCGLALLESGIKKDSAAIRKITSYIREQALQQTTTYEIALISMYLDRHGDLSDRPTVQFMGVRLLAAQTGMGGWSYSCGEALPPAEMRRLQTNFAGGNSELSTPDAKEGDSKTPRKKVDPNKPEVVTKPKDKPTPTETGPSTLHPDVEKYLRLVNKNPRFDNSDGDNSNTQFAIVGLWCARRAGLNADNALKKAEARFRKTQSGDGGWSYIGADRQQSTPSMTCAGLLGIALGMGAAGLDPTGSASLRTQNAPIPLKKDGTEEAKKQNINDLALKAGLLRLEAHILQNQNGNNNALIDNCYFLWGLERVCMALGLDRVGRVDWYKWGADLLVRSQQANGAWVGGSYAGAKEEVNTCFALLFLNRTNLTKELTKSLRVKNDLNTPSDSAPKTGGKEIANTPRTNTPIPVRRENMNPTPVPKINEDLFSLEANRLLQKLLQAPPGSRAAVLEELRDSKGSVYTEALIRAAAQGPQSMLGDIREALALRLKRMTRSTLQEMLKDPNKEIRLGAARAAGMKFDLELVPHLINVVTDTEDLVVQAARTSLKTLTGQDFGPQPLASADEKLKSQGDWKAWKK